MMYSFVGLLKPELINQNKQGGDGCQEYDTFCRYIQQPFCVGPIHPACELYMFYVHDQVKSVANVLIKVFRGGNSLESFDKAC